METQIIKGHANELKGEVKKMWGKLTDDDLLTIEGNADVIIGKIQKAYGYSRERAIKEFDSFKHSHVNFFQDKPGVNQETRMASTSQYSDPQSIKSKTSQMFNEEVSGPAHEYLDRARELGSRAMDRGASVVRENPGYTLFGAAAVGFLLGAFIARRR